MPGTMTGGKKARETNKERYGDDYYKRIGSMGGKKHSGIKQRETVLERYGDDYYSKIGSKGGKVSKRGRNGNETTR